LSDKELKDGGSIIASVKVKNTGDYKAKEIVQLYIRDLVGSLVRPIKELKGFDKIHLNPGEAKTVSVRLDEEAFRYYDPIDRRFVVEPGTFTVHVGASSADIRLTGKLEVPSGKY
jgi:beta-glucosidase